MKKFKVILRTIITPIVVTFVLLYFISAISNLQDTGNNKEKELLHTALSRAAVACYATEGAYPEDVEYLIQKYGIRVNSNEYTIKYEFIASNLMPHITILDNLP